MQCSFDHKTFCKRNVLKNVYSVSVFLTACHAYEHGARKRRQTEADESSSNYELGYDADALITFFTSCMSSTSAIAMDWYSVTDWAIVDSNWFYYSDNADCFG